MDNAMIQNLWKIFQCIKLKIDNKKCSERTILYTSLRILDSISYLEAQNDLNNHDYISFYNKMHDIKNCIFDCLYKMSEVKKINIDFFIDTLIMRDEIEENIRVLEKYIPYLNKNSHDMYILAKKDFSIESFIIENSENYLKNLKYISQKIYNEIYNMYFLLNRR